MALFLLKLGFAVARIGKMDDHVVAFPEHVSKLHLAS